MSDTDNSYSSENSSCSSSESDEENGLFEFSEDFKKLKPYEFEPLASSSSDEESKESDVENTRKGNTDWCSCDCCNVMTTEAESLCCKEANEILDNLFEGNKCVTFANEFKMVCLEKSVLGTNLATISIYTGEKFTHENSNYRFSAYKQYISWIYGYLGKHARRVIPSCVVWAIRTKYPSEDGKYVPFNHSKVYISEDYNSEDEKSEDEHSYEK